MLWNFMQEKYVLRLSIFWKFDMCVCVCNVRFKQDNCCEITKSCERVNLLIFPWVKYFNEIAYQTFYLISVMLLEQNFPNYLHFSYLTSLLIYWCCFFNNENRIIWLWSYIFMNPSLEGYKFNLFSTFN